MSWFYFLPLNKDPVFKMLDPVFEMSLDLGLETWSLVIFQYLLTKVIGKKSNR